MKEKPPFKLFGILGHPLSHTLSPVMQEAGFEAIGLKAFYGVFDLDAKAFQRVCRELSRLMLDGFNVTVPYKQAVLPYLDEVSPEAKAVGAVNTVYKKKNRWIGTNTDVYGFLTSLQREGKFKAEGKTALVFGAGGAARAVLYGLSKQGIQSVFLVNRNAARAQKLASEFQKLFPKTLFFFSGTPAVIKKVLGCADVVINATSLGLNSKDPAVTKGEWIPRAAGKQKLFFDLIYHVSETAFLKAAKSKGHRVLGGKGMLLFQGAKAFELWTGRKAPEARMRKALDAAVEGLK